MSASVVSQVLSVPRVQGGAPKSSGFYCNYLWDSITVLSDGNVTCGFDDPFGTRSYGNIRSASVREIFNSDGIRDLRAKLLSGSRCETCHLYTPVSELAGGVLPQILEMPKRLILETTIRCNLRCRNTSCDLNNDHSFKVRKENFLSFELYQKLMDELGPHLGALYFFNYGEPFLHPRAVDMLAYAKSVNPQLHIATSTNGLLLRDDAPQRIVEERLVDWMNFTIAGCDDASYQRYHHGGSFEGAFDGMRRVLEEKRRLGAKLPVVRWRYLLFNWNDSDEQLAEARRLAKEVGVDEFTFFLCSAPMEGRSRLRAPGQPGYKAIADAVDYEVHYQADPFADAGLYPPEHDPDLGTYCWTSREAKIPVMAEGSVAAILLSRPGTSAVLPSRVHIKTPWEERIAEVGTQEWQANPLRVPVWARGKPFPVTVSVDEVLIPFRHGLSNDTRELGVMVSLAFAERTRASAKTRAAALKTAALADVAGFDGVAFDDAMKGEDPSSRRGFVMQQYRDLLGREGDAGGVDWWTDRLEVEAERDEIVEALLSSEEFEEKTAPVVRLYLACFHRIPDRGGLASAIERFRAGVPLATLARELTSRGEFLVRYGFLGDDGFVEQVHVDLLGRSASESEHSQWAAPRWSSTRRGKLMVALTSSEEYRARTRNRVFTVMGYVALAHRTPDAGGFTYWLDHINGGGARRKFIHALLHSPEYAHRFSGQEPRAVLRRGEERVDERDSRAATIE